MTKNAYHSKSLESFKATVSLQMKWIVKVIKVSWIKENTFNSVETRLV